MKPAVIDITKIRLKNFQGIYSYYEKYFTREQLEYIWIRDEDSIPFGIIDWLNSNAQGAWGWWFENNRSVIGFELDTDCLEAKLYWL